MVAIGGNSAGAGPYAYHLIYFVKQLISLHMFAYFLPHISQSIFWLAGDSVVNVYINHEKKFAFVEMRTVEEASNAMALDGIIFEASISNLDIVNVVWFFRHFIA